MTIQQRKELSRVIAFGVLRSAAALLYSMWCKIAGEQPKTRVDATTQAMKTGQMSNVLPLSQVFMRPPSCAHCYTGTPHFIELWIKEPFLCLTQNGVSLKTQMRVIGKSGGLTSRRETF